MVKVKAPSAMKSPPTETSGRQSFRGLLHRPSPPVTSAQSVAPSPLTTQDTTAQSASHTRILTVPINTVTSACAGLESTTRSRSAATAARDIRLNDIDDALMRAEILGHDVASLV